MTPDPLPTRPLNALFLITSMEVGGAEILLANMVQRFDPARIQAQIGCLKHPGELGEQLQACLPVHTHLINNKFDARVVGRLKRIIREQQIDAVITVGAGDKMFWGRLAARQARVPVILSALHSTGWPDGIGRLNRMLTPITDGFIAVASGHRQYLIREERFPEHKVFLIPNGIDADRFIFNPGSRARWRQRFSIPENSPVCGIVAALRPEKNHELFLKLCQETGKILPEAHFLIVGDGPQREHLEQLRDQLSNHQRVHLAGNTHDIPGALSAMDVFSLTSHNEASPVSILEAMSVQLPVVAPDVGSINQAVIDRETGFLVEKDDHHAFQEHWMYLLQRADQRKAMGRAARQHVLQYGSLDTMTRGYTELIESLFAARSSGSRPTIKMTESSGTVRSLSQIEG